MPNKAKKDNKAVIASLNETMLLHLDPSTDTLTNTKNTPDRLLALLMKEMCNLSLCFQDHSATNAIIVAANIANLAACIHHSAKVALSEKRGRKTDNAQ